VAHKRREFKRRGTDVHSNTVESVFSLLKRGVMGTFHSVSRKHLPNYLNEFEFRHNTRKMDDGSRVSAAIRTVQGKRLEYRESVDNPPYLPEAMGQMDAPLEGGE
jgi:ISXO2-like transposase domain